MLLALQDIVDVGDDVFKASTGFIGGISRMGSVCGALSGGVLALGFRYGRGRDTLDDPKGLAKVHPSPLVQELYRTFREQNSSTLCLEITGCDLNDPEARRQWAESGKAAECSRLVGRTARLVAELLLREEARQGAQ